jgi:hypothetical protein
MTRRAWLSSVAMGLLVWVVIVLALAVLLR